MTPAALRLALTAAGYLDAEIRAGMVHIRDRDGALSYREHRDRLAAAGIPVHHGGWSIGGDGRAGWYWYAVKLDTPAGQRLQAELLRREG